MKVTHLIFKYLFLFTLLLGIVGCEKEEMEIVSSDPPVNELSIETLHGDEVFQSYQIQKVLKDFTQNFTVAKNNDINSVYIEEYDIEIITTKVKELKKGEEHSYTFAIKRQEFEDSLRNLVFAKEGDGYQAYLYTYNLTEQDELKLFFGQSFSIDNKFTFQKLDIDLATLQQKNNCEPHIISYDVCTTGNLCTHLYDHVAGSRCEHVTDQIITVCAPVTEIFSSADCGNGSSGGSGYDGNVSDPFDESISGGSGTGGSTSDPVVITTPTTVEGSNTNLKRSLGIRATSVEGQWIDDFNNDAIVYRLLTYINDHDSSEPSKDTARKIVQILAGTGDINQLTSIDEHKAFMSILSGAITRSNPEQFGEYGQAFAKLDLVEAFGEAELSSLNLHDWRNLTQRTLAIYELARSHNGNQEELKQIARYSTEVLLIPQVKSLTESGSYWPQNAEEWAALGEIMAPMLLEIGLALIPGSDIIEIVRGIAANDYIAVAIGIAGVTIDAVGGTIVKVIAKFGKAAYKSFKIIRALGRSLNKAADVIRKGFKFDVENGVAVIRDRLCLSGSACRVIAQGDEAVQTFAKKTADFTVQKFDDYVVNVPTRNPAGNVNDPRRIYQENVAGIEEFEITGNNSRIWADGLERSTGSVLEAKHIGNPESSPYIPNSSAPQFIRDQIVGQFRDELRRYADVIADPSNPLTKLDIITNNQGAKDFFESLLREYNIPGQVIIRP